MGLPNGMARISRIAIGGVWRPSSIAANIPNVDVSSGLRAMAAAKRSEGEAQAARAKADAASSMAWAKMTESFTAAFSKVANTYIGVKHEQKKDAVRAHITEDNYMAVCEKDPSKYRPDLAMELHQNTLNADKTAASPGFWRQSADTITEAENNRRIMQSESTGNALFNRINGIEQEKQQKETRELNDGSATWEATNSQNPSIGIA